MKKTLLILAVLIPFFSMAQTIDLDKQTSNSGTYTTDTLNTIKMNVSGNSVLTGDLTVGDTTILKTVPTNTNPTYTLTLDGDTATKTENISLENATGNIGNSTNDLDTAFIETIKTYRILPKTDENVIFGNGAGDGLVSGAYGNILLGQSAGLLLSNTSADYNVFIGRACGSSATTASNNVFIGRSAGSGSNASNCVLIGYSSGQNNTANNTVAIGAASLDACTGYGNTAIGYNSGSATTDGTYNTFIGLNVAAGNTSGDYNTAIGEAAGFSNQTGDYNIFIGRQAGYNETGSNKLYIEPTNSATPLIYGDFSTDEVKINGYFERKVTATITASATQSQGQQPLVSDINEVSTVGTANDVVTLPSAIAGLEIFIINNGANTLQIYPASGDNLGAGLNTSTTLAAGSNATFVSYDATNWEVK